MTFDPFRDFSTRGYLRNALAEKDMSVVKVAEHAMFQKNVSKALDDAFKDSPMTRATIGQIHKTLFGGFYPWAGQDRSVTSPGLTIGKGNDMYLFSPENHIHASISEALTMGNNAEFMKNRPGEVMGALAFSHPFLDGNGRSLLVAHTILATRAGISIDWQQTQKEPYLRALTLEMKIPGEGYLDAYLKPFVQPAIAQTDSLAQLLKLPGLGPGSTMAAQEATAATKLKPQS